MKTNKIEFSIVPGTFESFGNVRFYINSDSCSFMWHSFDKFLLNSDISNKESDPLSVPKTVRELKKQGYKESEIEKISHKNAQRFFKI